MDLSFRLPAAMLRLFSALVRGSRPSLTPELAWLLAATYCSTQSLRPWENSREVVRQVLLTSQGAFQGTSAWGFFLDQW